MSSPPRRSAAAEVHNDLWLLFNQLQMIYEAETSLTTKDLCLRPSFVSLKEVSAVITFNKGT